MILGDRTFLGLSCALVLVLSVMGGMFYMCQDEFDRGVVVVTRLQEDVSALGLADERGDLNALQAFVLEQDYQFKYELSGSVIEFSFLGRFSSFDALWQQILHLGFEVTFLSVALGEGAILNAQIHVRRNP